MRTLVLDSARPVAGHVAGVAGRAGALGVTHPPLLLWSILAPVLLLAATVLILLSARLLTPVRAGADRRGPDRSPSARAARR